jgi:hypothetical protein
MLHERCAKCANGLNTFDAAFERRFKRAKAQGELDAAATPAALAKVAAAILHSLVLRSRAGDARESLRATAKDGTAQICRSPGKRRRKSVNTDGTRGGGESPTSPRKARDASRSAGWIATRQPGTHHPRPNDRCSPAKQIVPDLLQMPGQQFACEVRVAVA